MLSQKCYYAHLAFLAKLHVDVGLIIFARDRFNEKFHLSCQIYKDHFLVFMILHLFIYG